MIVAIQSMSVVSKIMSPRLEMLCPIHYFSLS
jgi:hypothetical protein